LLINSKNREGIDPQEILKENESLHQELQEIKKSFDSLSQ
jgi:hypothetical protein